MFLGFRKAQRKRPTRDHYEREAALLLESRIAEGRPPPDVWRKAEEWRAKHGHPAGWYGSATPTRRSEPDAGRQPPSERTPRQPVTIGLPFALRLVHLPLPGVASRPKRSPLGSRAVNAGD